MKPGPSVLWTVMAAPMIACVRSPWASCILHGYSIFGPKARRMIWKSFRTTSWLHGFLSESQRCRTGLRHRPSTEPTDVALRSLAGLKVDLLLADHEHCLVPAIDALERL